MKLKWRSFVLLGLMFGPAARGERHQDVIDLSIRHQVIDHFGASDCWTFQKLGSWSEANRNKIADLLFTTDKGIGLSMWRFNIGGGINHETIPDPWRTAETFETAEGEYDWSRQASERWFARAAKKRGVPYLLGFANSPPGRMTRTGLTNSANDRTSPTNLKPGFEGQFARYLCDIVQHFRETPLEEERMVFDYLSPVNEPQVEWGAGNRQEGNRAINDDIRRMLLALHTEIQARKLPVKISAPESNTVSGMYELNAGATRRYGGNVGNYLEEFATDAQIMAILDGVLCYHDYDAWRGDSMIDRHRILGDRMRGYPNVKLWMSEICLLDWRRDLGMGMALDVAKLIHADLVLSSASAWHWWLAMSRYDYKDGLLYTDWKEPGNVESIIESKSLWALGNFSRFIRPGMRRVQLTGPKHSFAGLLGSAYLDPATSRIVIVYINLAAEPQQVVCTLKGAPNEAAEFTAFETSETKSLEKGSTQSLAEGISIPPRTVVTLVSAAQ